MVKTKVNLSLWQHDFFSLLVQNQVKDNNFTLDKKIKEKVGRFKSKLFDNFMKSFEHKVIYSVLEQQTKM